MLKRKKVEPSWIEYAIIFVLAFGVYFLSFALTGSIVAAYLGAFIVIVFSAIISGYLWYKREKRYNANKKAETVLLLRNKNITEYELEDEKANLSLDIMYEDNYIVIQKNQKGEQKVLISLGDGPILCIDYDKVIIEEDSSSMPSLFKFKVKQGESDSWSEMWVIFVPEGTVQYVK